MTRYRVLAWRGIPLQVKARGDGWTAAAELAPWFTEHVDRVAMADGLYGSDAYLDQFAWSGWLERAGSPSEVVATVVAELEAAWAPARQRWEASGELTTDPPATPPDR